MRTPNSRDGDCTDTNAGVITARSAHAGGVSVCLCDGSVQFIRDSIPLDVWQALGSKAGGEVELAMYPGVGHGFMREPGPIADRAMALTKSFIARQFEAIDASR